MLEVIEHTSSSYGPRTYVNATSADFTVAFAVDFNTRGEALTHQAAGKAYVAIPLTTDPIQAARELYRSLRCANARKLNVAGNGIYTLQQHGWPQHAVNRWVHQVLSKVHEHWPLEHVRSGGQTGVDMAGIVSAYVLGIPALALMPNGFIQRGADKVDRMHTARQIESMIESWADALELHPAGSQA